MNVYCVTSVKKEIFVRTLRKMWLFFIDTTYPGRTNYCLIVGHWINNVDHIGRLWLITCLEALLCFLFMFSCGTECFSGNFTKEFVRLMCAENCLHLKTEKYRTWLPLEWYCHQIQGKWEKICVAVSCVSVNIKLAVHFLFSNIKML